MSEERRVVTILFSDVTGSTSMGESSDPEDVRAVLGRYYAIAREVIGSHGGTVEKFIGDAVMAVFGIPQAHGDDAERALVAALELQRAVARDPQTAALSLRIGVNTGEVVAAKRGSEATDFLVTGDAVNVAARLQQHAEPGSILVGERTRNAVSGFAFRNSREMAVKGKREPVVGAVLVARVSTARPPLGPFLGRTHDLAQLELVARRAFEERRPQLVTITAPAGTGKSRLVEEFLRRMPATVTVATAQCLPYGAAVTFLPLRGLVSGLLNAQKDEELLPLVRAAFSGSGLEDADAQRLTSIIGLTLGDTADTERRDREEVFTAWRLFLGILAGRGPLVVVFEDLHWASDTLLDLVEHVTLSRTTTPLVMFALARPELLDRKPNWGGGRRNFTSLGLEPLDEELTGQLVKELIAGMHAGIAQRIVERSGGNPFFAGELVRAYEQRRSEGAADHDIRLPDTVHATVLARIDALPAGERRVLEYAAVAGRTVEARSVGELLDDMAEEDIAQAMDELVQRDLLVPQGSNAYTFRHIVIREVAYATLPRADRARAHMRLAEWLESSDTAPAANPAELVAYHYRQAMSLSPGGRLPEGVPWQRVVAAFELAARGASAAGAFSEAAEQLRAAIQLAPGEEHLRLLELRGDLLMFGDEAITGYGEAYERWRSMPGGDPGTGARLLVKRLVVAGRWVGSLSRPMQSDEFASLSLEARRLLALAPDEQIEDKLACARAFSEPRYADFHSRLPDELLAGTRRAVERAAARGDPEEESVARDALAAVYRDGYSDFEQAMEVTRGRLKLLDRASVLERIDTWSVLVWDLVCTGRYEEAISTYGEARTALRPGEPEYLLSHAITWATYAAMVCGRWDTALALGDNLVAMREEPGTTVGRFTFMGWIGAMRVAAARQDATRLARYRSAFTAVADLEKLPEPARSNWAAFIHRDGTAARRYLLKSFGPKDRRAESLFLLLYELGETFDEDELQELERQAGSRPPLLVLRVKVARALAGPHDRLREAIAALDEGHMPCDASRAAMLLALRTRTAADRADAERRLRALGDLASLQKLDQEMG